MALLGARAPTRDRPRPVRGCALALMSLLIGCAEEGAGESAGKEMDAAAASTTQAVEETKEAAEETKEDAEKAAEDASKALEGN